MDIGELDVTLHLGFPGDLVAVVDDDVVVAVIAVMVAVGCCL